MIPYWIMFLIPALAAVNATPKHNLYLNKNYQNRLSFSLKFIFYLFAILVGFRYEVGGDWTSYFGYLYKAEGLTLAELITTQDPGYVALNMISWGLGFGITGVNFMSAIIFMFGLGVFLKTLPRVWLGLACAVPYLIIVVGMGYTRQAVALSLAMVGLVALQKQNFIGFIFWVVLGALFHKTAVLLIPIAILTAKRQRIQAIGLAGIGGYFAYDALLAQHAGRLINDYITREVAQSEGAFIRLAMNALPAILLILFRKNFSISNTKFQLWYVMSLIVLAMLAALIMTGFSTVLDRMALYFIPLQLVVFTYLPEALGHMEKNNTIIVVGILFYYATVLFVWLTLSSHAYLWIPYQMGLSLN